MGATTIYKAFGLYIVSDLALPELMLAEEAQGEADIEIVFGDLSAELADAAYYQTYYAVKNGTFFLDVPGVAVFGIEDGRRITVSPAVDADFQKIRLYLLGTCMGAILFQRKVWPLHGSAVVIGEKAYAIVGDSGAGKSTLAAAFVSKGYTLLSDDIIPVASSPDGEPVVIPSYPQQKLWQESVEQLGMELGRYRPLYDEVNKYAIPVKSSYCKTPIPLGGVFELVKTDQTVTEVTIEPVSGLERFPLLRYHTYRNLLIPLMGLEQWHFTTSVAAAGRMDMQRITRPSAGFTAHEIRNQMLEIVSQPIL
ncbi:aldolase [Paenibacillus spongiae]|uniref:Aldolase n=1 Tax=Paenibacillus spongiae TaxID=2909671 RepID=A0ABY5SH87_9BACL|nr:aldolase [Paenibacillus spongiae]UVI31618.1 aldolase [Paenibacillus spongiae]